MRASHFCYLFLLLQEYKSGRFCKFDLGQRENLRVYNSSVPPSYDLSSVRVPVVLMYADNDWLADPKVNLSIAISTISLITLKRNKIISR